MICFSVVVFAENKESLNFITLNSLKYLENMQSALEPEEYLTISFGTTENKVAGSRQDTNYYTHGVPYTFRPTNDDKIWVLDSGNNALKLFNLEAEVEKKIDLSSFKPIVRDFAVLEDGFWFLNSITGYAYRTDIEGNLLAKMEGFADARRIDVNPNGELLVDYPIKQTILRFASGHTLKEHFVGEESLSLTANEYGQLYGLRIGDNQASLYVRQTASPAWEIELEKIIYDKHPGVNWAGSEVIGFDQQNRLYFSLIACDDMGNIFTERLYRYDLQTKASDFIEILTIPYMSSDLPRERVVTPDGKVLSFYTDDEAQKYIICSYSFNS